MKGTKLIFKLLLLSVVFVSCEKETIIDNTVLNTYTNGMLISAEGNWNDKDGSVSYVSNDYSTVSNFVYKAKNGAQLGGLIQSVSFSDEFAYIILNDVNQIVVVDKITLTKVATIETGISNPRYMAIIGDKGYVTNWGVTGDEQTDTYDDYIAVLDLNTNTVTTTITNNLPFGPEQIIAVNDKLYVSHKGARSTNNKVSVIVNNAVQSEIEVNGNPDEMLLNSKGELVVLCEGGGEWVETDGLWSFVESSVGAITTINTSTDVIKTNVEFETTKYPALLAYESGKLYYNLSGSIYVIGEDDTVLSSTPLYESGSLYGMSIRNSKLFMAKYAFTTLSKLTVLDVDANAVEFETAVGLGASKIYFVEE
ncbi:cell surface protein [Wenyingzhuangia sp. 1_MG-2023]|nr:cell surface protein [Wenyingzhuangia sp. 1_MG-2023]